MVPGGQGRATFIRVSVCAAVGPFAQGRLDEAFGLAVGLRPVGAHVQRQSRCDRTRCLTLSSQMRRGKIIAMRHMQATVLEEGTKRTWKIPCLGVQGYTDAERRTEQTTYEPPPEPVAAATKTREFQRGDTVTFDDRDGRGTPRVRIVVASIKQPRGRR